MNLQETLAERDQQYGSFTSFADKYIALREQLTKFSNYPLLNNQQKTAIEMILFKCTRLENGNSDHKDTWLDIAGYASLIGEVESVDRKFRLFTRYSVQNIDAEMCLILIHNYMCNGFDHYYINSLIDFAQAKVMELSQ